ncbi:Bug family tripartite tricarboxylate transporter substrate binding protein [Orrella marina]|uniref:Tripartite tricarboxylate transporter substrate binding protein n=1 Tax=Orrella marina TaxID=2163011 RepID=A0A2R4XL62_9BURK|nr:tripartite tricarboxylate transporter substrate binding protein [Orrella marina]AWB34540.1 hypothetical protein DBV39_13390 [Orrella marina]
MLKSINALAIVTTIFVAAISPVKADEAYPDRPITIVVAYPPGGGIDTLARLISVELSDRLGQPVVVLNKAGAAGSIGTASVARDKPDGYTMLLSGANAILSPLVDPNLSFTIKDFSPVARLTVTPYTLAISPSLGINTFEELVEYSKQHPGELNYGSTGLGSVQHLLGALAQNRADVDWTHIPYKGGNEALRELSAERVQIMFSNPIPLTPYLQNESIKVIGVATEDRIPAMPDVPTLLEQGVEDFDITTWVGLLSPAGTPESIRNKISDEIVSIVEIPKIRTAIEQLGSIVSPMPTKQFGEFLIKDEARWKSILDQSGFDSKS